MQRIEEEDERKKLKKEEIEEVVEILKNFDPAFHVKESRKKELKEIIRSSPSPQFFP
jgi:hypothetical protein